ncbi:MULTISPECIES: 3-isopropylmalate dehydrogenase [unclassified Leptolyngbya]|uniref:isocitrate/isopropylmalate dehydrogenase family protein n=1 Tax=unclassified Leptolyngbya TaxID=2650499 RepID=UPI001683F4B6|nr:MULTISPECIES: 3-isopropylmalate dehydrogenase [unclassified Leptolyngbya]MBD1911911.1 3-isopropylmalate dehydrogenase [Leptolyngbya sp. FACHB-8]MBD2156120.1 3-isopropylmalate dehydrogenase [Leptolyngbya sp. FACHB-16]
MAKTYRVAALPGEGIGPEVVEATLEILHGLAGMHGFAIAPQFALIGPPAFAATGHYLPDETLAICEQSDGILFGAVSKGGLLELRKHFDLFINLRPVRPSRHLYHTSPLRPELLEGVDLLFVRELASGIYFGASGRSTDAQGDYGFHTMQYHDWEVRRIARVALELAQKRRGKLTVAHKENALPHLPWTALTQEVAQDFPDVIVEPMLVDNLAMQLVMRPQEFDVVLAGNLFGDILSDLGGAIAGSIGMLGSASLNAKGFGLYEPIHGTAPDIAGKGIANPMGTLASAALMLEQWGEIVAAQHLQSAQEQLLAEGYRTADLASQGGDRYPSTREFIDRLVQKIEAVR